MERGTRHEDADIASRSPRADAFVARWPVYAIVGFVGLFCAVVATLWIRSHVILGEEIDATAWVILVATLLRLVTIGIALASIQGWGARLPQAMIATGLWGCAAAQLVYPVAELAVKIAILAGVADLPSRGVGDMSATGWFNVSAAWLIFGVPGVLFVLAARSHRNRVGGPIGAWPVLGFIGGVSVLLAIGFAIG